MLFRHVINTFSLFAFAAALQAEPLSAVQYTLRFDDAVHHYVEVEANLPTDGAAELELFMPVWMPGSYLVREFSGDIDYIAATSPSGQPLPLSKTVKNRWQVTTNGLDRVLLTYRLYGWDASVRGNWIEGDFAMIQGAPTFLTLVENHQRPYTVKFVLPPEWAGTYTPLTPAAAPHTYTAPDYDTLIDSPILAGSPQVDQFVVDGSTHYLVTIGGGGIWDNARAARNFAQLAATQIKFWGGLPTKEPFYLFNLLGQNRGGLEHKQAFVMMADRWLSRTRNSLSSWLSLVSHEYFHTWNGKRLRPAVLGPFDYEHEAYTRDLWIVEGITSYYQHIMLHRAGFVTREGYLGSISGLIAGVENTPGRFVQSLSDSSFDAWIKAYRPDANSVNSQLSYYSGGSLAGLLLDTEIRRRSDGTKSLDDVMHEAYARYSGERGYTEEQFITLINEVAGSDMSDWIKQVIETPGQFDYQPLLDWFGLAFEDAKKTDASKLPNGLEPADGPGGWLGADTAVVNGLLTVTKVRAGTPAYAAGVYVNDELIAMDGIRLGANSEAIVQNYQPGDQVELMVSRRGILSTLQVTLDSPPAKSWKLKIRADATPAQTAHLEAWLGKADTPPPTQDTPAINAEMTNT
ncbi:MAG: PDZ domain-containing protein [Cephaloticoccus sp.]|nr:PDZ domain-containing protein [Cephaloticoccus sp.]